MKKLNETPIGNLAPQTFRPTEAEKMVLLNIAELQDQGRHVTQQDAINVDQEELKQQQIGDDNLESAFAQLVKLKMIQINPDQTIEIAQAGMPVVDELKKAAEQSAETDQTDKGESAPGEQPQSNPPGNMQQPNAIQDPTFGESFNLIKYLNDLAKLND